MIAFRVRVMASSCKKGEITIQSCHPKPFLLLLDEQTFTANTHTPHSDTLVYHPTGTNIHTSFSSFTLHLPPSRRDWTSCSLPSAAATSRSLTTEALDAACHDRNSIHNMGWYRSEVGEVIPEAT